MGKYDIPQESFEQAAWEILHSIPEDKFSRVGHRLRFGLDIAVSGRITVPSNTIGERVYIVPSKGRTGPGTVWRVDLDNKICPCPDFQWNGSCEHWFAALIYYRALILSIQAVARAMQKRGNPQTRGSDDFPN